MTHTYQTSALFTSTPNRCRKPQFYMVEIQDFDNNFEQFEVEADSYDEAAAIAESLASTDIYNMNIYALC